MDNLFHKQWHVDIFTLALKQHQARKTKKCLWSEFQNKSILMNICCSLLSNTNYQLNFVSGGLCSKWVSFTNTAGLFLSPKVLVRNRTLVLRRQTAYYNWTLHHFSVLFLLAVVWRRSCITTPHWAYPLKQSFSPSGQTMLMHFCSQSSPACRNGRARYIELRVLQLIANWSLLADTCF